MLLTCFILVSWTEEKVDFAILYGSQAKGKATPENDIDIAIFSRKFRGKSHYNAQVILQKYLWEIKVDIQPVGYPMEEYSTKDNLSFVGGVIKKEGILICKKSNILL
ncbi:MAG: hypothetical protein A2149_09385 [Candidatus Schekmanbacteria bacterium RBG_16_38_11]|uniref:Polymerase beta nucleotidyltransferase domain-containing protein n=1 Tax=Candidatus Schekmanbacteria bacterium RBG_16_38_11 TaxID=1817880 RepID=A0A1F7RUS1_9BACT|nr:MAG: hypothetical protein A2149_09385 [Candidatus Schekmanbacteria bacterium RBG_16_38_11]